jgi:hypothetical protein
VSARVPRERRRARAPLVRHTTPRGPLTEAPPESRPTSKHAPEPRLASLPVH